MKNTLIISFILFYYWGFAQQHNNTLMQGQPQYAADDTLHWSKDRKLTWDDFQGIPDTTSTGMAGTSSGFVTKSKYTSDSTISIVVSAVFYKKESWVKAEFKDSATLNHEQGHFDIAEVYARKSECCF
ncbi:MAG: hypothetical protein KL787_09070 [Taibaiella sp.]|nr:hypothetical protein [Taibaiella sp.]